jgi:7-cyano-7-deazaguanine synthase
MDGKKVKSIVLFSGGLDSTCLLYKALNNTDPIALLFNYGQRHNRELKMALHQCEHLKIPYKILDITFLKEVISTSALLNTDLKVPDVKDVLGDPQPITYVPNRNMMFLSIATAVAESSEASLVYYGAAEVDTHSGHWDCSLDFLDYMNKTIGLNRRNKIEINAPFITYSKSDIIKEGISNKVNFMYTHTCYKGEDLACGKCASCSSRIQGFIEAGYKDPIPYSVEIPWKDYNCKDI